jgi:elongation factor G
VFVNKMDKIGADFEMCLRTIRERLGVKAVPIQLPIGSEASLKGVDRPGAHEGRRLENEALGANYHDEEIPADLLDAATEARSYMVENAVELDDEAMEAYLGGEDPRKRCSSAASARRC